MKYFRRGSALSDHMIKSLRNDNNARRLQIPLTVCNVFSTNVLRPGEYKSNPLNTHLASSGIISSNASRYSTSAQDKLQGVEEAPPIDQRKLPADYNPSTFDPTEHRNPPTERVFRLVDEIAGLTLLEVADLTDVLKKKFNVKDMPIMTMMMPGMGMPGMPGPGARAGASKGEDKKPAKTSFDLKLESFDAASKIKIIKEVRTFTDLGLKEAKDLVEKTPALLKKGVTKEEGEQIIEKLNVYKVWLLGVCSSHIQQDAYTQLGCMDCHVCKICAEWVWRGCVEIILPNATGKHNAR